MQPHGPSAQRTPDGALLVYIPGIRLASEANLHQHWSRQHRRTAPTRALVAAVLRTYRPFPPLPLQITLTRHAPSQGLDDDNLQGSCKGPRDGIADALGLPSDRHPLVSWHYAQLRAPWGLGVQLAPATSPLLQLARQLQALLPPDAPSLLPLLQWLETRGNPSLPE